MNFEGKKFQLFVVYFISIFLFGYMLFKIGIIYRFSNDFLNFIQSILFVFLLIPWFVILETLLAKKKIVKIVKNIRVKNLNYCGIVKVKRQFFVGLINDEKEAVFSKIVISNVFSINYIFLCYYGSKGFKLVDRVLILFNILKIITISLLNLLISLIFSG